MNYTSLQHHDAGTLLEDGSIPSMVAPRRLVTFFLVGGPMMRGHLMVVVGGVEE